MLGRPPGKLIASVEALCTPQPSIEEMRRGGFEPEDYAHEVVEVWPECWEAVTLFSRLRTQWRHSFAGPCGLDYLVVFRMLDDMALPAAVRQQLFEDIRVMESQALVVMDRKKE